MLLTRTKREEHPYSHFEIMLNTHKKKIFGYLGPKILRHAQQSIMMPPHPVIVTIGIIRYCIFSRGSVSFFIATAHPSPHVSLDVCLRAPVKGGVALCDAHQLRLPQRPTKNRSPPNQIEKKIKVLFLEGLRKPFRLSRPVPWIVPLPGPTQK